MATLPIVMALVSIIDLLALFISRPWNLNELLRLLRRQMMRFLEYLRCQSGKHEWRYRWDIYVGDHKMTEYVCKNCGRATIDNNRFTVALPEMTIRTEPDV